MYKSCIKLLLSVTSLIATISRCDSFCFHLKKTLPSTSFPYITLAPGATFPPTSTGFVFSTGTAPQFIFVNGAGQPQFTFPTIVTAPNTLPPFPTLPTLATFPTLPTPVATFPTLPLAPGNTGQCPDGLSLCPITNGAPVATNGFGFLPNGCPCFDPRMGQALSMILQTLQRGQRCYTREFVQGFCINEQNCNLVLDGVALKDDSTWTMPGLGLFGRRTICGYNGIDFLVCCPYQPGAGVFDQAFQSPQFTFGSLSPPSATPAQNSPTVYSGSPPPTPVVTDNICGISNFSQNRVVGGNNAKLNQYPWIAALGYVQPGTGQLNFFCGGALISQRHVLTTAHCVNDNLSFVRLGEHDLNSNEDGANPIDIPIAETILHEEYVSNLILNDIAMLVLQQQAIITDKIRPICLPINEPLRSRDITGFSPFLAGWGTTTYQGSSSSILQDVQVPIVSTAACEANYKSFFPNQVFDNRIICAGYGGKDACQGDSGGPLMLPQAASIGTASTYYVLVGLVSYGYECAREGFPGVYTRITAFIPWIENTMYQNFF